MGMCQEQPDDSAHARAFLTPRAVPGIEHAAGGTYRRTLRLAHGAGVLGLGTDPAHVTGLDRAHAVVADPRDRAAAESCLRRLLGSPTRAAAADAHLRADPILGPLVARRPGLRVPGTVDGGELAIRAVLGQQVSIAAARTLAGRLVAAVGDALPEPDGALTHLWPRPEAIAEVAGTMAMPRSRQVALAELASALADGELRLEPGADLVATRAQLRALPGIGAWTAEYVALRALDDPDAWMPTDLGVRHALERLGASADAAEAWRPYRAYAVAHLWASLADAS
jgi:AraC family transcriptional regulator, regulatory protein of adaptative response / DNA-3-methyladenine glycosylase II